MAGGPGTRSTGFTLLELIAVLGLLSVLLGIGVGVLQRGTTELDVASAVIADQLRVAANTAKSRGLPTEVHILPGDLQRPTRLQARVLAPVGVWHLEADGGHAPFAALAPELTGTPVPNGRFGGARRPDPGGGHTLLTVETDGSVLFALEDGFALRLEVELEDRAPMVVARLGRALALSLDRWLVPVGKLTVGADGHAGHTVTVRGHSPLPLRQWVTLELVYDGSFLRLRVDGRERASAPARGTPLQSSGDLLEVSPGNAPVLGLVDEVVLLAYQRGEIAALPFAIEVSGLRGPVRFDSRGEPTSTERFVLRLGENERRWELGPRGVLHPWSPESSDG